MDITDISRDFLTKPRRDALKAAMASAGDTPFGVSLYNLPARRPQ